MSLKVIDYDRFQLGYQLLQAASKGEYETLAELVESGVHVDISNFGRFVYYEGNDYRTPLQVAACNGHSNIVEFLINSNAALDVRDKFGLTPLHIAAENGHKECVDLLLNAFCDPSPPISITQANTNVPKLDHYINGTTPLHLAARNNHIDCVKILLFYGADFNAADGKNRTPLFLAAEVGLSECVLAMLKNALGKQILSIPDYTGNTPLHFAVKHGMVSSVRELLRHGSDANHVNNSRFTPLHSAISNIHNADSFEIVKLLVLEGYNTNINARCSGDCLQTPLAMFVKFHSDKPNRLYKDDAYIEIVCFLIRYGATVDFIELGKGGIFFENELFKNKDNYDLLRYMVRTKAVLKLHNGSAQHMMPRDPQMMPRAAFLMPNYDEIGPDFGLYNVLPFEYHNDLHVGDHHDLHEGDHHDLRVGDQDLHRRHNAYMEHRHIFPFRRNFNPFIITSPTLEELRRIRAMQQPQFEELQIPRIPDSEIAREKLEWFENLMSQPRQLQHYCRCTIRTHLQRVRDVHKLSIPVPLQDYILLSRD